VRREGEQVTVEWAPVLCLYHNRPAVKCRLIYPQPPETPPTMRWKPPGPDLWVCEECRKGSETWTEEAK
jgi:hypothetical protein